MFWWRNRDESSVQQKSNSPALSNDVDVYQQDYINQHRNYFDKLLGGRLIGKKVIEPLDITILKEAYDKAHVMRSFEIDLFWKRAGYCFTIIAALIALCGGLISAYIKEGEEKFLFVILFISFVGVIFTILSEFMVSAGESWKKNWELHISMLEPLFSGHIYSTHLVSNRSRLSITRITSSFFLVMYACWLGIIIFITGENDRLFFPLLVCVITVVLFIIKYTLSKNKAQEVLLTSYYVDIVKKKKKISIKTIVLNMLQAFSLLIVITACIAYYFLGNKIFSLDGILTLLKWLLVSK